MNSKKTKLLIISDFFYPHWTGISKSITNLVKSMNDHYQISVLTVRHQKNLKHEEYLFNSKITRADYFLIISRSYYSIQIIIKAFTEIPKNDVILINSPSANILFFSLLTKIFGKKLLIFHQGDLILPKDSGLIGKLIELIFDIFTRASISISDKVSTYTRDYALHSRVIGPFMKKFTPCIWPVLVPESKNNQDNQTQIKLKKLKQKNKVLMGFGGRFVEEKGFDILLKAIPDILKKIPNAVFVFAGEVKIDYENFYENNQKDINLNKKSIIFLGNLDEQNLASFYKNIDMLIIPSRSDCFNLMQAEAMLQGCPTITSDIPGARWLIKQTGFGQLFISEDSRDLAKKTIYTFTNKKKIMKNYKNLLKNLNFEKNVLETRKFIEK